MKFKSVVLLTIFVLIFNILFPSIIVLAKENNSAEIITGDYQFASDEGNNIQNHNSFEYRDDCFTRSSYLGCKHLEILSIQTASASVSYYGAEIDKYEIDPSQNAYNVTQMLEKMKFNNVTTNKYYAEEKEENSMGVAVGHKNIVQDGKIYTLLAIIPRSAGYKQEWAGNFNVGDGDIHVGFKLARDEILRYVKKYIEENNIKGDLKVWTAGWSRGAAISNMIGGFFAGGGIEYFGNNVAINSEDVYCYTIGTPKAIKNGLDKNVELSVSGSKTSSNDTIGEPYEYTKGGNVQNDSSIYNGIRIINSPNDAFPLLPPEQWEFTNYGKVISLDEGLSSESEMLKELKSISPYVYNQFTEDGKIKDVQKKTFDLKTLSIVNKGGTTTPVEFLKQRIKGVCDIAKTNKKYQDEQYQEAFKSFAGVFGMILVFLTDSDLAENIEVRDSIEVLAYTYLDYASKQLQKEGKADNDIEGIAIAIEELLEYFTDEDIDNSTFTVDDFIKLFSKYISDNEDEPISDMVVSGIVNLVPVEYQSFLSAFKIFDKNNKEQEVTVEQGLKAFIKACYYGPEPESEAISIAEDAEHVRSFLYSIMGMLLFGYMPEINGIIAYEDGMYKANARFEELISSAFNMLKNVKDESGSTIKVYGDISEMADDKLVDLMDKLLQEPIRKSEELYGTKYKTELESHVNTLRNNITKAREIIASLFLYTDNGFNTGEIVENVVTLISNAVTIPVNHFNEVYLAYARTSNRYEDHFITEDADEEKDVEPDTKTGTEAGVNTEANSTTNKAKSNRPKTGDNIVMWINLMIISTVGFFVMRKYKKS